MTTMNRLADQVATYRDAVAERAPSLVSATTGELRTVGHEAQRIAERVAEGVKDRWPDHQDGIVDSLRTHTGEEIHRLAGHVPKGRARGARKPSWRKVLLVIAGGVAVGFVLRRILRKDQPDFDVPSEDAVSSRAEGRPPEEESSDDPGAQAQTILEDSETRLRQAAKNSSPTP
jgi:hypothetical protein